MQWPFSYQICVGFSRLEGSWRHPCVDELPQLLDGHAVDVLLTQLGLHLATPCCCQIPLGCYYCLVFVKYAYYTGLLTIYYFKEKKKLSIQINDNTIKKATLMVS